MGGLADTLVTQRAAPAILGAAPVRAGQDLEVDALAHALNVVTHGRLRLEQGS